MIPKLLDLHDTAKILKISIRTLRRMIHSGECPSYVKLSSKFMFTEKSIKEFIGGK